MGQCAKLKANYDPFIPIIEMNMEKYLAAFKIENRSIEAYESEVNRLNKVQISNHLLLCSSRK